MQICTLNAADQALRRHPEWRSTKVSLLGVVSLVLLVLGLISTAAGYSVAMEDIIATKDVSAAAVVFPSLTCLLSAPVLASGLLIGRRVFRMTHRRMSAEAFRTR
jgi:hypothetical protein